MAVHGWNPRPGTVEATPLPRRQPVPYNRWKAHGERALRSACRESGTRFVILRPGIVYGPRSQWIAGFARAVVEGRASVVAGGRGICNAIYVDNLVHAVDLALEREEAADETFLVADDDAVTWRMLYEPVCRALGHSWDAVADLPARSSRRTPGERLLELKEEPAARVVLDRVPRALRNSIRRLAFRAREEEPSQDVRRTPALETSILQTCGYRFPTTKARRLLGFEPPIAFDEASRRTVAWLGFAGYPVAAPTQEAA
jgi:nucleoside-diphosphate-sugar epimerase